MLTEYVFVNLVMPVSLSDLTSTAAVLSGGSLTVTALERFMTESGRGSGKSTTRGKLAAACRQ